MPALRVLRLYRESNHALDAIATHCKHLVSVDLRGLHITDDSLKALCNSCPSLEVVKSDSFSESSLRVLLRHSPPLRALDLSDSGVTGQNFSLQRLSVAHCSEFRTNFLRQVSVSCPQLRQLDVSGLEQLHTGDLAAALAGCPQLQRLTAEYLRRPVERCLPPAGLPALIHLEVRWSAGVTDTTLRRLPDLLPSLQTLHIAGCDTVTAEGLYHLRRCRQLGHSTTDRTRFSDFLHDHLRF